MFACPPIANPHRHIRAKSKVYSTIYALPHPDSLSATFLSPIFPITTRNSVSATNQPCILQHLSFFNRNPLLHTVSNLDRTAPNHISFEDQDTASVNPPSLLSGLIVTWRLFHTDRRTILTILQSRLSPFFHLLVQTS